MQIRVTGITWMSAPAHRHVRKGRAERSQEPLLCGAAPLPPLTRSGARVTLQNLAAILERLGADACAVVNCACYLRSNT
jgi:hypothetical protein